MASVVTSIVDPGASSITVAVRVRPFTIREAAQLRPDDEGKLFLGDGSLAAAPAPKLNQRGLRSVIKVVDDRCLVFDPPEDNPVQKFSRSVVPRCGKKVKDQVFAFDRVFDDNTTQTEVYEGTTKELLDSVLDGYNATVFAYGATGCGKTHTITGTAQHPGIIFMTMQELFEKIQDRSQEKTTEVSLSYLEIYNETIRDLLVQGGSKQGLMLREDSAHSVTVAGLSSHHPRDVQEVMDMIVQGNEYRTVSPTEANATSSRSHAVLQINIAQKDRNADIHEPHTMATLSIIDLAGSERASATKNRGERLLEGANINKSLLALGGCINALCDPRKRNHVPYRNSKLTRLLKFSLGGNCKTVMIVCVSPSSAHFDETQNTLRYANRAKNIQTKVTRNVFNVNRHVKDFLVKIDEQMALITELKAQQRDAETVFYAKFRKQLERRGLTAQEGAQRLRAAYDNAASERQEKVANMKKLRAFERRIGLLGAWMAAFDTVCGARGDEESMPPNLVAMRRTAQGILVELESSRYHVHQKLERCNWERSLDSALQHSLRQLADTPSTQSSEAACLSRDAEALKTNFMRDAYREVLEHENEGDAAAMQALLTAQFEILVSLSDTLEMNEADAVSRAKQIIGKLLETGFAASSQVVKADGPLKPMPMHMPMHMHPPSKRGTPRKRHPLPTSRQESTKPAAQPSFAPATLIPSPSTRSAVNTDDSQVFAGCSPAKMSPRRRKVHPARKGVSVSTPQKRKSISKRAVRWRDDDGEDGTLADFEKTPQKFAPKPEPPSPSPSKAAPLPSPPPMPAYLENDNDSATSFSDGGSPSLRLPETTSIPAAKPNRFQAGFLSKSRLSSAPREGSPQPRIPGLSLNLASSDTEDKPSPLRTAKGSNLSPPPPPMVGLKGTIIPRRSPSATFDENTPSGLVPPRTWSSSNSSSNNNNNTNNNNYNKNKNNNNNNNSSGAYSDSDSLGIDPLKVRAALHAKKQRERRISSISAATVSSSSAKRLSSISSIPERVSIGPGGFSSFGMTSLPTRQSLGAGGSHHNSNGISRRRDSLGRRKSPPMPCSPPDWSETSRSFTLGQTRRMNLGGGGGGMGHHGVRNRRTAGNHSTLGNHSIVGNHSLVGNSSIMGPTSSSSPSEPATSFLAHVRPGEKGRRTTIGANASQRLNPQIPSSWW